MSPDPSGAFDRLLEDVLCGVRSLDDPEVQALLASSPEARERLEELTRLTSLLDAVGEAERQGLAHTEHTAQVGDAAPGADRIASTLERLAQGAAPAPAETAPSDAASGPVLRPPLWGRRRPTRLRGVALAAAALLLALPFVWNALSGSEAPTQGGDPGPEVLLGTKGIEVLTPQGRVAEYASFSWRYDLPVGGWFELRVWDAEAPPGARPLVTRSSLESEGWTPTEEQRAKLSEAGAIRWEVRAWGASGGELLDSIEAEASLAP